MKGDINDTLRESGADAVRERLNRAMPFTFDAEEFADDDRPEPLTFVDVGAWQDQPVPPQEWVVYKRVPCEQVTLLGGDGATGKTTIGLQLCIATALGRRDWLGGVVEKNGTSMFFTAEESEKELHRRLADILPHYNADYRDVAGKFIPHCRPDRDAVLGMPDRNGIIRPTPVFLQLQKAVLDIRPMLVVIEAASDVFGGDENNRPQVRAFLGMLRGQLAMKCETAVMLLQHPSLTGLSTGTGTSGSTQWNNSARSRLYLSTVKANGESPPDNDLRKLEVMKANFAAKGEIVKLRWEAGVFKIVEGEVTLEKLARAKKAEDVYFALLSRFTRQDQRVSPSKGPTYAPARFAEHPEAEGITSAEFAAAQQRLLDADQIHIVTTGPQSHQRSHLERGPR